MPFTKFTNLDFDQIKTSIKDYLRSNSNFTDFDFEGSNLSILIDTLAYNTYITAFNSNMIVNESFLDSASIRENVVSLARNIGYVPKSRRAAKATINLSVDIGNVLTTPTPPHVTLTLSPGLVCVGSKGGTSYIFSISESITATVENVNNRWVASFNEISVYQGTFLTKQFIVNGSIDQRFILDNSFIDTTTLVVTVKGPSEVGSGREYRLIDNILNINDISETYLLQEVQDEKYELLFGDGIFGKKLENNTIINASYIVTEGIEGNGPSSFSYAGNVVSPNGTTVIPTSVTVTTVSSAQMGADIEPIDSIKYFAPRLYSSQYRAVTAKDYESIIQQIYPNTESVSVIGGEEMDPPQYGNVIIIIKPRNATFIPEFDKRNILKNLKKYSLTGINQQILDPKILYVEIDSSIYYNTSQILNVNDLRGRVTNTLLDYSTSLDLNKFGGRFKYSKLNQIIDSVDNAITSNITKVIMRRNLNAVLNSYTQYEICFGNKFHINEKGYNIKSTAFKISGETDYVYLTDIPNKDSLGNLDGSGKGVISVVKQFGESANFRVIVKSAGTVNYTNGEILLSTIEITETALPNNIIEIQATPESNDIIALKDLYLYFDVSKSKINMVRDTITSGENISGIGFEVTSSYLNGELKRV
jgi:hypothetical protein